LQLGDTSLEFIVTANERVLNPGGGFEPLEECVRSLYLLLKRLLLVAFAAARISKISTTAVSIIEAGVKKISTLRTRGIIEEECAEAASTVAAKMVEANLQKRVFFESNSIRVLTLQALSAISVISNNSKVLGE